MYKFVPPTGNALYFSTTRLTVTLWRNVSGSSANCPPLGAPNTSPGWAAAKDGSSGVQPLPGRYASTQAWACASASRPRSLAGSAVTLPGKMRPLGAATAGNMLAMSVWALGWLSVPRR